MSEDKNTIDLIIDFSVGPCNKEQHNQVLDWLLSHEYKVHGPISYNGDHYSEIFATGNYNEAFRALTKLPHLSIECWD